MQKSYLSRGSRRKKISWTLVILFLIVLNLRVVPRAVDAAPLLPTIYHGQSVAHVPSLLIMWIDINLTTQKLSAYNVGGLVLSTPISSGKRGFATIQGKFQVTRKVLSQRLAGRLHGEIWDIPNVPFIMYFSGSFAIHGAYWHNDFGHPVSHGCVNVPVNYGALLYSWTPIGTTVVIHK